MTIDTSNGSITPEQANLLSLDANPLQDEQIEPGVVLDAAREVRVKFYMGNVCYSSITSTLHFC